MGTNTDYPSSSDLKAFLVAAGLTVTSALNNQLEAAVTGAAADLERETGRKFIAVTETRRLDPPTNYRDGQSRLILPYDVVSLSALNYTPYGSTATLLVVERDYNLGPSENADKDWPYWELDIYARYGWIRPLASAYRRSLYLTGVFGFGLTVPDNVWMAVLARAGWRLYGQIAQGVTGGVTSWQSEGEKESYGDTPLPGLLIGWGGKDGKGGQWGDCIRDYKRWI